MADMGTPTTNGTGAAGAMQLWVNGQSLGSWNNLWLRTDSGLKLNILWLSLYHHDGTHSVGGVIYDNGVVSSQRVGCPGTLLPFSPPSSPKGLKIK